MARTIQQISFPAPMRPSLKRVAAYARVSSGKDAMLHSLSAQVSYYSALIQKHTGWLYCGVYADEAFTGTKDSRDGFQSLLAECRAALQENAVVVANGRVSVKEDEAARLIVEGVQPIETYDPGKNFGMNRVERVKRETSGGGAAGYFLTVPSRDSAQMHKVENLLCNIFDGGTVRVYFRFQDTGRAMLARHMAVKDDPLLRAELERILGKDCVKVQDVEHSAK